MANRNEIAPAIVVGVSYRDVAVRVTWPSSGNTRTYTMVNGSVQNIPKHLRFVGARVLLAWTTVGCYTGPIFHESQS